MKTFPKVAATAMALALLAGCTNSGSDASSADGAGLAEAVPGAPGSGPTIPGTVDPARQVISTATASVVVDDPADAAQQVSEMAESVGGRVDERTEQAPSGDDGATAELVVRVPADALTGVLSDLEDIGDVQAVSVSRSDVTATVVDADARISALRTSVARLQALMDGAATTEALLAAEGSLSERQGQLESLLSQQAQLADQVELSTLDVHLAPAESAPAGGPDGFLAAVGTGWRSLGAVLGGLLVVLGVVLPWAVLVGAVAAVVLLALRLARRRAAVAAPVPPPEG